MTTPLSATHNLRPASRGIHHLALNTAPHSRLHASACVRMRQHASAYVACCLVCIQESPQPVNPSIDIHTCIRNVYLYTYIWIYIHVYIYVYK
jgi:hypothetical protein